MNFILIVTTVVATLLVSPIDCQIYPSEKLFVPLLETVCYDEVLDSCGNDSEYLDKPGVQIYCMLCRGGVYRSETKKDLKIPKSILNFQNLYVRFFGCFKEIEFINCAYTAVHEKYKGTEFDLSNPGCAEFDSLQNTLAQLYAKGKPYC